jgi:uncharacterized protein YoxC
MRDAYIEPVRATSRWLIGWALSAAVLAVAATLLITIILLARKIAQQVDEIDRSLERSRRNTEVLFAAGPLNESLQGAVEHLRQRAERAEAG